MKECPECKQTKEENEFYKNKRRSDGLRWECKECVAQNNKKRYMRQIENRAEYNRKALDYYRKNPQKIKERSRDWQKRNPEKAKERAQRWKANNPDKAKRLWQKANAKRLGSPMGRLNNSIRSGIIKSINKSSKNYRPWEILVGYTVDQLKKHLEKRFVDGMTWDNYGEWHIDHIIPINAFNFSTPEDIDFNRCWALKNLRPLWKVENLRKHDKVDKPFQPSLEIAVQTLCSQN